MIRSINRRGGGAESDPHGHILRAWLTSHDAFIHHGLIITNTTKTTSVRGISCIEPIASGTTLISIPGPLTLSDAKVRAAMCKVKQADEEGEGVSIIVAREMHTHNIYGRIGNHQQTLLFSFLLFF